MSNNKCKETPCHMTSIGGQAVIEGVMMRGPKDIATAVRKSDGTIIIDKKPVNSFVTKYKLNKIPLVRGVFSFVDSLVGPLSLINALIVTIAIMKKDDVAKTLTTLEHIWDEYDVYDKSHS